MALNHAQLAILKTELDTDPKGLGYTGTSHPEAAVLLNTIGLSSETIGNTSVLVSSVRNAIKADEFADVAAGKRDLIMLIMSNGDSDLDITNADLTAQFMDTFTVAVAPLTRAALVALSTREASRAEVLFGAHVVVTKFDVAEARQLP